MARAVGSFEIDEPRPGVEGGQKWRTFIKNHSHELYACDFMTQYTVLFTTVYVFVVVEISTRRIVLCNVTESPTLDWVKIQIRDIAAFDRKPRFLLHGNDGVFGQFGRRRDGFRCHLALPVLGGVQHDYRFAA